MTKLLIATIIGFGLMIPTQALATSTGKTDVKKEMKKNVHHKKSVKAAAKKAKAKKAAALKKNTAAEKRKVVQVDFSKPQKPAKKAQLVTTKDFPKKDFHPRRPASQPQAMTVSQLKKSTKPYWAAYCRDGIVLNSQVYCALKNPQKNSLKPAKQVKMASSRDMEAKKRK